MTKLPRKLVVATAALAVAISVSVGSAWADAKPNPVPDCFRPWEDSTKMISYPAKEGPYRLALVNGFAGNDWRIQMI
ncbi:MAG: hypothetical protein FJX66_02065 [Alphaproteobacteria bacterium]|nr:hypothetical protein [Alphaproteobacteria bacterium]